MDREKSHLNFSRKEYTRSICGVDEHLCHQTWQNSFVTDERNEVVWLEESS